MVVLIAGVARAATPDEAGSIHGCHQLKADGIAQKGNLRVIDPAVEECDAAKELSVPWNRQGPMGDPGERGPEGERGPQGESGPPGGIGGLQPGGLSEGRDGVRGVREAG